MSIDDVSLSGGGLRVARFGTGPKIIVAVHGIIGSMATWDTLVSNLPAEYSLVAMDLRGRGHSRELPGPYGLKRHTDDVLALAEQFGEETVLIGHSMGATIAALAGAQRRFQKVVMIDGGLPLSLPEGIDPYKALDATFGATIARLGRTFRTIEEYKAFFLDHPVFAGWRTPESEQYASYDALPTMNGVRSRVVEDAVREDGLGLINGSAEISSALQKINSPLTLLRASRGRMNEPGGMLSEAAAADWRARLPELRDELIDDTNHYSILFNPRAVSRIAAAVTTDCIESEKVSS